MSAFLSVDEFEAAAQGRLTPMAWDYFRSGADDERTLARNREAFARAVVWPRVLRDVAERDLGVELLGQRLPHPILVAPTAYHRLAHSDGERATAAGARAAGALYVVATMSTVAVEDLAPLAGPRWFQLYVHRDRELTRSLVERAAAAGCSGLMLTVDTPMLGRRRADERNGFALPEGMVAANLERSLPSRNAPPPAPSDGALRGGVPDGDPIASSDVGVGGGSALRRYFADRHDASFTWRDLEWVRSLSSLPLVLKGILRADDADRAVSAGASAIVVSNHGGRQLDGAPATLDALPSVLRAVAGRVPVLLDGGVRRGVDVLVALALGARAVLVGRPVLWGLAVDGAAGVERVLSLLVDELARAMALCGCRTLAELTPDLVGQAR